MPAVALRNRLSNPTQHRQQPLFRFEQHLFCPDWDADLKRSNHLAPPDRVERRHSLQRMSHACRWLRLGRHANGVCELSGNDLEELALASCVRDLHCHQTREVRTDRKSTRLNSSHLGISY